jgi:choline dehydrogenase-like flavoprotein
MQRFDYLIIGAGSAGCVLANRLSVNERNSVALFEYGSSSNSWKVDMPSALLYTMHDPKMNWKYYSEPEPFLNNRKIFCPRGKMGWFLLGGTQRILIDGLTKVCLTGVTNMFYLILKN